MPADASLASESPATRRLLYAGEGVTLGGIAAMVLPGAVVLLRDLRAAPSLGVGVAAALAVLLFFAARGAWLTAVARRTPRDRSPAERDWVDTREWWLVAAVAVATTAGALAASVALWGLRGTLGGWPAVLLPGAVTFAGLAAYVRGYRRLGVRVP